MIDLSNYSKKSIEFYQEDITNLSLVLGDINLSPRNYRSEPLVPCEKTPTNCAEFEEISRINYEIKHIPEQ